MAHEPRAKKTRVLLIGVADYDHYGDIPSVRHNLTQLLSEVLTRDEAGRLTGGVAARTLESPTGAELRRAVRRAAGEARDLLLCYFSGHGYLHFDPGHGGAGPSTELYLLPREATTERPWEQGIRYGELRDQLCAGSPAERVVLILDCCYSGAAQREPLPTGRPFALITSAKPRGQQWKGDGLGPTPFTAALLAALRAGGGSVTVGDLAAPLRERAARDAAEEAAKAAGHGGYPDDWFPQVTALEGAGDTSLTRAAHGDEPPLVAAWRLLREAARTTRVAVRDAVTWAFGRGRPLWHRLAGALAALAFAGGCLGVVRAADALSPPPESCPIPLQLRVLTTPEYEQAMSEVLAAFEGSQAAADPLGDRPEGCRQLNAYVYAAPGAQVSEAFRDSAAWAEPERACPEGEPCPRPLRDLGPRPDVWLPASAASYERVKDATALPESAVYLGEPVTLARTPAVLAVPGGLPGLAPEDGDLAAAQTGHGLAELVEAAEGAGLTVRRAVPASSDASLDAGLAVGPHRLPDTGPAALDDLALLCGLADGPQARDAALLIAERSLVSLLDEERGPGCLTGRDSEFDYTPPQDALPYYVAYYPSDVPVLDLEFVPVHWESATRDTTVREAAVERLRDWLGGSEGRAALTAQGFREARRGIGHERDGGDPLNRQEFATPPALREDSFAPAAGEVEEYLERDGTSRTGRDVVFVVDVSTSSYAGQRVDLIDEVLRRALGQLAPGDRYALLTAPADLGGGVRGPDELRDFDAEEALAEVDSLAAVNARAPVNEALDRGFRLLGDSGRRSPLLVLITDDLDSEGDPSRPDSSIPAAVVSFGRGGCALPFNQSLARPSNFCFDDPSAQATQLAAVLARLAAGEAAP
ncbi:caspase family protein [Streptomyces hoynatensis]|uniref:VWFA domain-containing protein n=1 Tax=Streptomyces hoynatensis TaxID=1141874 RepID=A0A3A9YU25_9ACTN|nr:caspase family protein [Streptomyces hoynatensis]RKN39450.1 hypothetical protein D7294_20840 [Streptomyces hoynatensis]